MFTIDLRGSQSGPISSHKTLERRTLGVLRPDACEHPPIILATGGRKLRLPIPSIAVRTMHDESFEHILNAVRVEFADIADEIASGMDEVSNDIQCCGEEIESVSESVLGLERSFEQRFRAFHRSLSRLQTRVDGMEKLLRSEDHDINGKGDATENG
ncbi:hypothetical protein [Stieleria mannarensis]|uniref:hypothetical protein n=1 Tax=Stieleria mannarensis TaxID=2755585 RepID=UPI00160309F8|nr:hypothetical protein [Rhodopirellula sp. JC639]